MSALFLVISTPRPERPSEVAAQRQGFWPWIGRYEASGICKHIYVQVLIAILIGIAVGHFFPTFAQSLKPLSDAFIRLIKMITPPLIFTTIVCGASQIGEMRTLGRIAGKTIIYFEVVTTLALLIGMVMVNLPTAGVDYHVPFGGRKGSSYGPREQGRYAQEFFTVVKTAYTLP